MQAQIAVADVAARQVGCLSQLPDRAIFFTSPCINHSEISDQRCAFNGVFANRRQLDSTFAFANGILVVPEYSINYTEGTNCSCIVWLVMYFFGELLSRTVERRTCCRLITTYPSSKTLAPVVREWNVFVKASTVAHF